MVRKRAKSEVAAKVLIPEVLGKEDDDSISDSSLSENALGKPSDPDIEVSEKLDLEASVPFDADEESLVNLDSDDLLDGVEVLAEKAETPLPSKGRQLPAGSNREERASGKAVVPYDPLQAYLREIRSYPPLSREEERELAIRYYTSKDLEAAYRLVTSNLWLVVKIAHDYEKAARGILDLIQEGNMGLLEAVKNFDPYRGVRFPSYAVWWIKAYIVRFLIANWRLVKIGTTQAQRKLFFNLKKEKEKLEREGFFPAPKLLAEKLSVKESEVIEMEQRLGSADVSVDAPLQNDAESTMLSVLPGTEETQEDLLDRKQIQALIAQSFREFAATLKAKELLIFEERMLGEDKATLQDISDKLGLSRERVRQIENRLRDKLKSFLETKHGPSVKDVLRDSLDF